MILSTGFSGQIWIRFFLWMVYIVQRPDEPMQAVMIIQMIKTNYIFSRSPCMNIDFPGVIYSRQPPSKTNNWYLDTFCALSMLRATLIIMATMVLLSHYSKRQHLFTVRTIIYRITCQQHDVKYRKYYCNLILQVLHTVDLPLNM